MEHPHWFRSAISYPVRVNMRTQYSWKLIALLIFFVAGACAQTSTPVTLSFNGTVTGDITAFSTSGSGTFAPFGAASLSVMGMGNQQAVSLSFTFTFASGGTLTASAPSAIPSPPQLTGNANITGGTGPFANAAGMFSFSMTVDGPAGNVVFTLTGSGNAVTTGTHGDVTLAGLAGGAVVSTDVQVTLPSQDFFSIAVDAGTDGSAAPAWIEVTPSSGYTNAVVQVSADPAKLKAGSYTARLVVSFPNGEPGYTQNVTFQVTSAPPQIEVSPGEIELTVHNVAGVAVADSAPLFVTNAGGGGPQPFTASIVGAGDTSYLTVTPSSGQTGPQSFVTVQASTKAGTGYLDPGVYTNASVRITSGSFAADIPVKFLVTSSPSFFSLSKSGFTFSAQENVGTAATGSLLVMDGSGPVNWTAKVQMSTADFVTLSPASGSTNPGNPSQLTVGIKPGTLTAGAYYALVQVTPDDPNLAPEYFTVVYNVTSGAPLPDVQPAGLVFVGTAGAQGTLSQNISVYANSSAPQTFELGAGGYFFEFGSKSGTATGSSPTTLPVVVDIPPTPGISEGSLQVNFPEQGVSRSVDVLLIGLPAGAKAATVRAATAGCTPSQLAMIATGLAGGFNSPAGWPSVITMRVVDDCANPVANAHVVLNFSNGDPPLAAPLEDAATGTYTATWVPSHAGPVTISARATSGSLTAAAATVGAVSANPAPVINTGGVVNNVNPLGGDTLAPGTIVSIYGAGLASAADQPQVVPLPTTDMGTSVIAGGVSAPLFYISPNQVNLQLPGELQPNTDYSLVVAANGGITVPYKLTLRDVSPGVVAYAGGGTIAQHLDYSLVDEAHPAKPGEVLIMYLLGLGATDPPVASDTRAPSVEPLARAVDAVTVTVDGTPSQLDYVGLTPGSIGLYQIDFTVPQGSKSGDLDVVVTQKGVSANVTTLPVSAP
jgi:uncharacterized protein (TIGR03437 family)